MSSLPGPMDGGQRSSLELDSEHAQRTPEAEPAQAPPPQVKPKERQKFFEEAFQQDMEQYLPTGYLHVTERRGPIGSMSSMEVNVDMLEQMDLTDVSDHEALDVFLHSGGEDNSAASPGLGPEAESFTTEISLVVPTQAELLRKLSSSSFPRADSTHQNSAAGPEDLEDDGEDGEGARRRIVAPGTPDEVRPDAPPLPDNGTRKDREPTSS